MFAFLARVPTRRHRNCISRVRIACEAWGRTHARYSEERGSHRGGDFFSAAKKMFRAQIRTTVYRTGKVSGARSKRDLPEKHNSRPGWR